MKGEKRFYELSEFREKDVELFRSSDLNKTAIYFTDVEDEDREKAEAYFEILKFEIGEANNKIYIRYPGDDYFTEILDSGGQSRGDMETNSGVDVWTSEYRSKIKTFSHGNDLMFLQAGEFNFMKRVAYYNKGNKFDHPYPNIKSENLDELDFALSMMYLKLPENIRHIPYCYKTKDENPTYFLVDRPRYNFQYTNHRFFLIKNDVAKEYEITEFNRYHDGGTTYIKVIDENNEEHTFFSPTKLPEKTSTEKWDDQEIIEVTDEEITHLINLLGLDVI